MKYPMDHKIKRPFRYVRSEATNLARRFAAIRRLQRMRERHQIIPIKGAKHG